MPSTRAVADVLEYFMYPVVFHGATAETWHAEKHYKHWCDLSRAEFTRRGIPWSTGTEMFRGMTKKAGDCWHQTSTLENKTRMAEFQRDMCLVSMLLRGDGDWLYAHQARTTVDDTNVAGRYMDATQPSIVSLKAIEVNPAGRVRVRDSDPQEGWGQVEKSSSSPQAAASSSSTTGPLRAVLRERNCARALKEGKCRTNRSDSAGLHARNC